MSPQDKSIHLGDGAYATLRLSEVVVITANHHNPELATDAVYLEPNAMRALIRWWTEVCDADS